MHLKLETFIDSPNNNVIAMTWNISPGESVNLRNWIKRLLGIVHGSGNTPKSSIRNGSTYPPSPPKKDQSNWKNGDLLHLHSSSSSTSPSSSSSSSSSSPMTLEREHLNPLNPPFLVLFCKLNICFNLSKSCPQQGAICFVFFCSIWLIHSDHTCLPW